MSLLLGDAGGITKVATKFPAETLNRGLGTQA